MQALQRPTQGRFMALQRNPSQTRRAFCRNSEAGSVLKDRPVQVLAKCKAMANAALVMKPS